MIALTDRGRQISLVEGGGLPCGRDRFRALWGHVRCRYPATPRCGGATSRPQHVAPATPDQVAYSRRALRSSNRRTWRQGARCPHPLMQRSNVVAEWARHNLPCSAGGVRLQHTIHPALPSNRGVNGHLDSKGVCQCCGEYDDGQRDAKCDGPKYGIHKCACWHIMCSRASGQRKNAVSFRLLSACPIASRARAAPPRTGIAPSKQHPACTRINA